jgi:hypothetical protein
MLNVWWAPYASCGYGWMMTPHKVEYVHPPYNGREVVRQPVFWKWSASPQQWPWTLLASARTVSDDGCHAVMQLGVWWLQLGACAPMPSLHPPPRPAEQLAGCGLCRHTSHHPATPHTSPATQPQTIGHAMQLVPAINIQHIDALQPTVFSMSQRLTHIGKISHRCSLNTAAYGVQCLILLEKLWCCI